MLSYNSTPIIESQSLFENRLNYLLYRDRYFPSELQNLTFTFER